MMKTRWFRWQRGQALAEYWPTIPAAIAIMLAGGLLVNFVTGTLLTTVDYLETGGLECSDQTPEDVEEGPTVANPGPHKIELVSRSYDEENDTTTVTYRVSSQADPSISHWILGIPRGVDLKGVQGESKWEWVTNDKKTGATGLKFDTGYAAVPDELDGLSLVSYPTRRIEDRVVILTLGGYYQWDTTPVAVKAGGDAYTTVITAPVRIIERESSDAGECEV